MSDVYERLKKAYRENPMGYHDEVIAEYRALPRSTSQYMRAYLEAEIWRVTPAADRKATGSAGIGKYLVYLFGGSIYGYAQRHCLFNAEASMMLWPLLETGMTITQANAIHRQARKMADEKDITVSGALKDLLVIPVQETVHGIDTSNGKDFWRQIKQMIRQYIESKAPHGDIAELELICADLTTDLKALSDSYIKKASTIGQERRVITRRQINDAFRTLRMDPPKKLATASAELSKAKRQKRNMARLYHPDRNNGDESMRPQYESILAAYNLIEEWYRTEMGK